MRMAVLLGLGSAAAWNLVLGPMRGDVEALESRVARAESEIQRSGTAAAVLPQLQQEVRRLEDELHRLKPPADELAKANALLAELQSAAGASHLRITALKPRPEPPIRGFPLSSVEIGVEGAFHELAHFLGRLASSPRLMTIPEINVKASSGRASAGRVAASVGVVAFDLVIEEPVAVAGILENHNSVGRRDPFVGGQTPQAPLVAATMATGKTGLAAAFLADVTVRGIVRGHERALAILEVAGQQSFVARPADRLADSIVRDVRHAGVVFAQADGKGGSVEVHKPLARGKLPPGEGRP